MLPSLLCSCDNASAAEQSALSPHVRLRWVSTPRVLVLVSVSYNIIDCDQKLKVRTAGRKLTKIGRVGSIIMSDELHAKLIC